MSNASTYRGGIFKDIFRPVTSGTRHLHQKKWVQKRQEAEEQTIQLRDREVILYD
jgi:hypothetical protein